jgi:hypothetical protein
MITTHRFNDKALFAELDKYTPEERERILSVIERLEGLPPVLVQLHVITDGAITHLDAGSTRWTASPDTKIQLRAGDVIELRILRGK